MKKDITILMVICSVFSIIMMYYDEVDSFKNISISTSCIFIILILELLLYYTNINYNYINIVQFISVIVLMVMGINGVCLVLPIIIFKLVNGRLNIAITIIGTVSLSYILVNNDVMKFTFYTTLINLYLFRVNKQTENSIILKEQNRNRRAENYILESKLERMDRYLEQSSRIIQLKEREVIAQKLHDHLGHRITSAIMQLEVTKETMANNQELSKQYLITAMESLREGMNEIRFVLKNIKPKERVIGIENIKEILYKFECSGKIKAKLNVEGELEKVKHKYWEVIEANIREGLTNIAKYSDATEVKVGIYIYNKILRVEIRDNGRGGSTDVVGLGLSGMERRVESLKGRIDFYNDNGFVINMVIKLEE